MLTKAHPQFQFHNGESLISKQTLIQHLSNSLSNRIGKWNLPILPGASGYVCRSDTIRILAGCSGFRAVVSTTTSRWRRVCSNERKKKMRYTMIWIASKRCSILACYWLSSIKLKIPSQKIKLASFVYNNKRFKQPGVFNIRVWSLTFHWHLDA